MALNFPDSPNDGDQFVDSVTGESWTYEASTNSWTSDGLTASAGIVYKGGIDITTTAPIGAKAGWMYTINTSGTVDASFSGIAGENLQQGAQIIYNGTTWDKVINGSTGVFVGENPPPTPANGQEWWHSKEGRLYIYYKDADSSQWVDSSAVGNDGTGTTLNFPSAPTANDTYTANGVTYTWDGVKWAALARFVNAAGDTMTGALNVPAGAAGTSVPQAQEVVQKSGDTMTGSLTVPSLNGGQLAGFRNVIINGNLTINQRGVDVAAAATGDYGQDRWKKTAGGMTQVIEEGNFEPGATYTLSGTNITTQQLTAPASGNWTLPDVPVTARKIQLEPGTVATPFEHRPIGIELALCQRYYETGKTAVFSTATATYHLGAPAFFKVTKRVQPTVALTNMLNTQFPATVGALQVLTVSGFTEVRVASASGANGAFASSFTADAEL